MSGYAHSCLAQIHGKLAQNKRTQLYWSHCGRASTRQLCLHHAAHLLKASFRKGCALTLSGATLLLELRFEQPVNVGYSLAGERSRIATAAVLEILVRSEVFSSGPLSVVEGCSSGNEAQSWAALRERHGVLPNPGLNPLSRLLMHEVLDILVPPLGICGPLRAEELRLKGIEVSGSLVPCKLLDFLREA